MATNEIFVDTSGLYAMVDKLDAWHDRARHVVEKHVLAGGRLVVTDSVISESVTLARARSGYRVAARVLDLIEQSVGIRIEWIGPARFDATKTFFRKYHDHSYSFVDCSSFVVMRELDHELALTSDGHFSEAGFRPLLVAV
jgi:predicted nucleic acid-binding protein